MNARLLAASAAALLAVACGGSSKSSPPPAPSATYTGGTGSASLTAASTADKTALVGTAKSMAQSLSSSGTEAMAFGAGAPQKSMGVKQAMRLAADLYHDSDAGLSGAVTPTTKPCANGGSLTVTVNHQNAAPSVTTNGDYVDVAFAGCSQGGVVSEGSFRLTIDQTAGDDFVMEPTSITTSAFGLTIAFDSFLTVNPSDGWWVGVDGDLGVAFAATVSTGKIEYGIAGTHFDEAVGVDRQVMAGVRLAPLAGQAKYHDTAVETYDGLGTAAATLVSTSWDLDARLCTTELGGCVNIETNPVFLFAGDPATTYPGSGALTVYDGATPDAGDWVRVTANDASTGACTVSWHVDGADGSLATSWDSL